MEKKLIILTIAFMALTGCDLRGKKVQAETDKEKKTVTVNFINDDYIELDNALGKAFLYVQQANKADQTPYKLAETAFETEELPFSVTFEFPKNHWNEVFPTVKEQDSLIYYVGLEWDSNGDGQVDSLDVQIDYVTQFPKIDLDKIDHPIFIK